MDHNTLFAKTPPGKLFVLAALPGAIGMLASALYQLIDGILVGQVLGDTAFAAINLAMPFVIINFALADLIGVGSAVPISVRLGQKEEKAANFQRLGDLQNAISARKQAAYVGKTLRCLVDVLSDDPRHNLNARTAGGRLVHFSGDEALLGQFVDLRITDASTWALFGELA